MPRFRCTPGRARSCCSPGKPEATARRLLTAEPLERFTPRTEIDGARLLARLAEIRARGVARSLAELDDEIAGRLLAATVAVEHALS